MPNAGEVGIIGHAPMLQPQLEMQMWPSRAAGIPAQGQRIAPLHIESPRRGEKLHLIPGTLVLLRADPRLDFRIKPLQMRVDRGNPIGVKHIQRLPIPPGGNADAHHAAAGHRVHGMALLPPRAEVGATMEMVRPHLSKASRKRERPIER